MRLQVGEQLGAEEALRRRKVHAVADIKVGDAHAQLWLHAKVAHALPQRKIHALLRDVVVAHTHRSTLSQRRVAEQIGQVHGIHDGEVGHEVLGAMKGDTTCRKVHRGGGCA